MDLFLQIVGGLVVAVILFIALGFLYFRLKFGKHLDMDSQAEPLTIHLIEDILPDWLEHPRAIKISDELKELGFEQGKAYEIHEMPDVSLVSYFIPPIVAVLYKHHVMNWNWVDVCALFQDGREYTFTNAPAGSGIETRPECIKKSDSSATVKSLFEAVRDITREYNEGFKILDDDTFRASFESSYKKDMAWRNRKGGLTYKEFLNTRSETQFSVTDAVSDEAFTEVKLQELIRWEEAAILEFLKSEEIPEDRYYEYELQYLMVPFTTHAPAFMRYLEQRDMVSEKQSEKLSAAYSAETDTFALFEKINALQSPDFRATFVKDLEFPLTIKIYKLSTEMTSDIHGVSKY